ncbi:creatinine amidohydrolase [Halopolyspora algeriensis]|uniref:Creatinine amidohydrolase n=1 Tax=Halopolyspora algeriensis TaxID=1500506 RepID=A0A368VKX4_9ACTN|nr:mycofactocin biosynthesis peptidyl-dipeptidase MftE [Halopolyspora algeriensis]RCW40964.1 creatinine amidohydrolase [Halopolyspora algeriensis]TQM53952.1 creatinine amidohydrolase [Halopolyspora algeriensis]
MSLLLTDQAWPDLVDREPLVVLPLGACEQHGPHLPVDTDTAIATAVARSAVGELAGDIDVLLAPEQPYAASGEHEGFPGTVSIGCEALQLLLVELGRSLLCWAGRLLIVNGHGGNSRTLAQAVARLRDESRDVAWWSHLPGDADAHAGRTETALMMALKPPAVHAERAKPGRTEPIGELLPELMRTSVRHVSPNGVLGDPAGASTADGERMLSVMVERLCADARSWHVTPSGRLLPCRIPSGRPEGAAAGPQG